MIIKQLDNRFKLCKSGQATHMTDVPVTDFHEVEAIMVEAYGTGQAIFHWQKQVPNQRDWFYSLQNKKILIQTQSTSNFGPQVYSYRRSNVLTYRVYFRREEQAMYLALKQI